MSINITKKTDLEAARLLNNVLNGDIDMNDNAITNMSHIDFDLNNGISPSEGRLFWNGDDGTLNVGMPGGSVNLQIGQESLIRVKNDSGSDISNGTLVYISGSSGINALIDIADNRTASESLVIGMATEDISKNQKGYVTCFGLVRDINTAGISEGSIVWLGQDGSITSVRPTSPVYQVKVGVCIFSNATEGIVFICIDNIPRISSLSDVYISGQQDNENSLYWNSSELRWEQGQKYLRLVNENTNVTGGSFNLTTTGNHNIGQLFSGNQPAGNYSHIEADGTLVFYGDSTVWKDINIGGASLGGPPGLRPGTVQHVDKNGANTGIFTLGIAVNEAISGVFEMQHDYKEGSNVFFHIHFQGIAAPTGTDNINFRLDYCIAKHGEQLNAITQISKEIGIDTRYASYLLEFDEIVGTNITIGDQFIFSLTRINASSNEYAGEALLYTVGIHYQVDTVGSRSMLTK